MLLQAAPAKPLGDGTRIKELAGSGLIFRPPYSDRLRSPSHVYPPRFLLIQISRLCNSLVYNQALSLSYAGV